MRLFLLILFSLLFTAIFAQVNNCGVKASISPAAVDSIVPSGSIISFSSTSTNATSVRWLLDGIFSGVSYTGFNYQIRTGEHIISLVAYNGNCSDTTTVVYFAAGTPHNTDSLLMANYGFYSTNEEGTCIDKTQDGGFILGGVQSLYSTCGEAGILIKLRDKGCIDWSKKFISPYYCNNSKVTEVYADADTNYYVVIENVELAKLDKNGYLLWTKKYSYNTMGILGINAISGDDQGNIYIASQTSFNNGWTISKLDGNGNVVWNKGFFISKNQPPAYGQYEFIIPKGIVTLNGKIYVAGSLFTNNNSSTNINSFNYITKLDAFTGTKEWQYGYADPENQSGYGFPHLSLYGTSLMMSAGNTGQMVTLIDPQGSVIKSIKTQFGTSYATKVSKAGEGRNGHIYMMQWTEETLPLQPYYMYYTNFAEIDTSLNKYWGMVTASSSRNYFSDATVGLDKKFAAVGINFGFVNDGIFSSQDFAFLKVDNVAAQQPFCNYNNYGVNYTIASKIINRSNFSYLIDSSLTVVTIADSGLTATDAYIQSRYTCPDFLDSCSFMKLTGPLSMCSYADVYTYHVHRNKKCVLKPQWILSAGVSIINQTDSTLSVKFPALGTYKIASVLQSCIPVKDSLIINIVSKSGSLNLGNDTTMCANTFITLHAGSNFLSYLWNDGSVDTILKVSQPGIYWVQTIDSCGSAQRDSITIRPFNFPLSIGPDRSKCNNDTLHLNAPSGFLTYQWTNNYNISSTQTQNVVINPLMDTIYYLKAEKSPNCFAYDSVRIKVFISPKIDLGVDKGFCLGDSIVLDAGSGFSKYLWSTSAASQQIIVKNIGVYSVAATTTNQCTSRDTLIVLSVYPNPVVKLDHDSTLCTGAVRVLSAGNFVSYLWNTGNTSQTISVNNIGVYSVTVSDNNNCKGSDTTKIVTILPSPSNFLPADTALCSYGSLQLSAKTSYVNYLWNTNAITSSITISRPAIYWLQVKDINNCLGRDSIIVAQKNCLQGFFIPNAFSPNNDGKNDIYRPMLFGKVLLYEFTIYNQWGEIVFKSTDVNKGWDGKYKSLPQDNNIFVWICKYQFENEGEKIEKGTVLVLR